TPPGPARGNVFVEPELVVEVRFTEVTSSGYLRQPVYVRRRNDKHITDCSAPPASHEPPVPVLENMATTAAETPPANQVRFVNLDKIFWPDDGYTKADLLHYYETVWPHVAPYLRDRPVVLTRYPDGITGKNFFQKNAPEFTPTWVTTCRIEDTDYFICNDVQ